MNYPQNPIISFRSRCNLNSNNHKKMRENIPAELRQLRQWVCANADKIPMNPLTGKPASATDPATWVSFDEAEHTPFKHIGFALTKEAPYSVIDLDHPVNQRQESSTKTFWRRPRATPKSHSQDLDFTSFAAERCPKASVGKT